MLDLAILGSGPAALSAGLYAARAGLSVHIYGSDEPGGTLMQIDEIANYPGFQGSGRDLAGIMRAQATSAGAKLDYGECLSVQPAGDRAHPVYRLVIDDEPVDTRTVLVATGSQPIPLDFEVRSPVSYCALCDGPLAAGKRVIVVGGGNSGVSEAIFLSPLVESITLITRSKLKAEAALQERLRALPNITIREHTLATPELLDTFDYVFVCIGKRPATSFLEDLADQTVFDKTAGPISIEVTRELRLFDSSGYLITGRGKSGAHAALPHQTAIPGIFAAGDVRSGVSKQAIVAAGDGAAAAIEIARFLR